jgi:hypothetical protein
MTEPEEEWRDVRGRARAVMFRRWAPLVILALLVVAGIALGVSRYQRQKYCITTPC